jgi:glycosyltransferase involved in cell wall biosynthesis
MSRPRSAVVAVTRSAAPPWWWPHVEWASLACDADYWPVVLPAGRPRRLLSAEFLSMCRQIVAALTRARRERHAYVFTFECDWSTFLIAAIQTALFMRRPRHVVLQFIMREPTPGLASRVKYAVMGWCFRSVYRVVCSARRECVYYERVFGWPAGTALFVPLHTDPAYLERSGEPAGDFAIAAGRTFRDYATLLAAVEGTQVPLVIVASPAALEGAVVPAGVEVRYDLPGQELAALIARSAVVVVPLRSREISIGQSVLLEAMAMGKAVVVTRVPGTEDYVEHMETGWLVPPGDPAALRDALTTLVADPALRTRIGEAARRRVLSHYLPRHYAADVARSLARA